MCHHQLLDNIIICRVKTKVNVFLKKMTGIKPVGAKLLNCKLLVDGQLTKLIALICLLYAIETKKSMFFVF